VVENGDKYVELPTKWEINDYNIMERFCGSLDNEKMAEELYSAIRGKGAFQRFRYTLQRYGMEDQWYNFREAGLKKIAIRWCGDNDIILEE
jgi:hypothetical protein